MRKTINSARQITAAILLAILILSQGISAQAAGAKLPSGTKLPSGMEETELGAEIEQYVSEHEDTTAGMEVSVFRGDRSIYTGYFGHADREAGIVAGQDTVMEWGSVTKLLVWVSVMQLWEQGKIDLEKDVRDYLPEGFLDNLNYDAPVTMYHLMNHNAGFQETYADIFVKEHDGIGTLEDSLKAHEPEQIYEPGTVTAYSNWGAALAGYIVERISGESFDDYVHQHIFEPLGMEHSALSPDLGDNAWVQDKRKELQCYTADGTLIRDCFYYITLYPTGMCTSTLADFETFGRALLMEDSPLFEKNGTWETLFTPTAYLGDSDVPSNYHGFWVVPYGVETVGHGGNSVGSSSYLMLDRKNGIGAVVMTNQSEETVYNSEMMELVFGAFSEQDYFGAERNMPEGIYRIARTVRKGPFKIISFFMSGDEMDSDGFWATATYGSEEKICFSAVDCVRVPLLQYVSETALFILWIVAFVCSVISLAVKLIRKIVYACHKKKNLIPLGRWSAVAAFTQVTLVAAMAVFVYQASSYALASSYAWLTLVFAGIATFMNVLIVYGIAMLLKTQSTKKRKCYNWLTIILLAAAVVNVQYWDLYMFWEI